MSHASIRRAGWLTMPHVYLAICTVAMAVVISPILIFATPPLFDYPAHLAKQGIIHDLLTSRAFSGMYKLHFAIIPNLGVEAIMQPLLFLGVPLEIAGRIFLLLTVVILGSGVINLHRALFQRMSYFPLISFAFVFNRIFLYGFLNYILGVALALHAFAWWLRVRQKPALEILPLLLLWAVALFFCHLIGALLLVGLIGSYEASLVLGRLFRKQGSSNYPRVLMLLGVTLVLLIILFRLAPLSEVPRTDVYTWSDVLREIPDRLRSLPSYLTAYSRSVDILALLTFAGLLGLAARYRSLQVSWPMVLPIFGLLLVFAIIPEEWAGTAYISARLPIIVIFLLFSSVDIVWDLIRLQAILTAAILAMRTAAACYAWSQSDAEYGPMLQAIERLPTHSAIYTAIIYRETFEPLVRRPWAHFDAYAAIHNKLFVHGVFADPTQGWLVPTAKYAKMSALKMHYNRVDRPARIGQVSDMFDPTFFSTYDFLLAVQPDLYPRPFPPGVRLIVRSGDAALYALHDSWGAPGTILPTAITSTKIRQNVPVSTH